MIWLGIFIGINLGVVLACLWAHYHHPSDDECQECRASYSQEIEGLHKEIHGLKSTKGALGKELQAMAFRASGYRAR